LLLGLLLSVSEGFTQTFALYDNTYKLYPLYNCKEVRFKLSNPYNNEIYYYAYRRTYGTTDWGNPISGWGGGSLASIPANNFVNTDPILLNGDFEYKVVFYSGTDVNNPANLLSDNNILQVRIAPNPGSRLVTFSTSNCIYNTLSIGLQNSQNGVNYQLYYNNGTNKTVVGSPVSGNSSTITFPDILSPSVGVYSISGTDVSTGCISEMLNDKTTLATRTVTSSISASTNPICSGDQVTFTSIVGGNGGVTPNYIWQKSIDGGNSFTDILNETNSNFNSSFIK
jgi:hypothetical protein